MAGRSNRKVLIIAYYFPPFGSVGWSIRAVKFVKYLPETGWRPIVLTIEDDDYLINRGGALSAHEIPAETPIYRARAMEPQRATFGRLQDVPSGSPGHWAKRAIRGALHVLGSTVLIPDDKILWVPFAVSRGRTVAKRDRPDVVFATCPPYSAGVAGYILSRRMGKPFVLDIRDDWLTPLHLAGKTKPAQALERRMEATLVRGASAVVLVTEASHADFLARYPDQRPGKFRFIPNGCDLAEYEELSSAIGTSRPCDDRRLTILHSGALYQSRNPSGFVAALQELARSQPSFARRLKVVLRGDVWTDYKQLLSCAQLGSMVEVGGFLSREAYLKASRHADLMLVIGDQRSPHVIPGKVYECWAVGKPILMLAGTGAAAKFVQHNRLGLVASPNDPDEIAHTLVRMVRSLDERTWQPPSREGLRDFDRAALAAKLANLLDEVSAPPI